MTLPSPVDDNHRRFLQAIWDLFVAQNRWPTLRQVDRRLDQQFGIDAYDAVISLPSGMLSPDVREPLRADLELRLTVAGASACSGSQEVISIFLQAIRFAAELEKQWPGRPTEATDEPTLATSELPKRFQLPAAGQACLLEQVGHLLSIDSWWWSSSTRKNGNWEFLINRHIRPLRSIETLNDYWSARAKVLNPTLRHKTEEVVDLTESNKVFISHAASDRPLADLLRDTLILGGVPEDRVFYSSARSSGIPSGQDVRSHLREELRKSSLVIELVSETFLSRPMCLMELGGAWVLEKPTYPVVVPPLTRQEATQKIGDVHIGILGSESEIDEFFDELSVRLSSDSGIVVKTTSWNRAARFFKEQILAMIASMTKPIAVSTPASTQDEPTSKNAKIAIDNFSATSTSYGTEVYGEATNVDSSEHTVALKATIFDNQGKIAGTAGGVVNQLSPDETKTFTLTSSVQLPVDYRLKVQVDTVV
ncbi:TIR domain-containing protein [Amycolatopsis sp. lyj-90]|uniref:TIR domain-containing protein n=1 Tax=Amycolatopsis sp. lyj-90 TaxID=2789285 RepID=UPI003977F11B